LEVWFRCVQTASSILASRPGPTSRRLGPTGCMRSSTTVIDCTFRRNGDAVRLFTRRGYDWSARHPAIAVTAVRLRARSFTIDGEAVVCGPDGVAVFDALHRRGTVSEAMLYAFDLLELGRPRLGRRRVQAFAGLALHVLTGRLAREK
jgi:hypothetical protein